MFIDKSTIVVILVCIFIYWVVDMACEIKQNNRIDNLEQKINELKEQNHIQTIEMFKQMCK